MGAHIDFVIILFLCYKIATYSFFPMAKCVELQEKNVYIFISLQEGAHKNVCPLCGEAPHPNLA
jgi:hypothetical protein